MTEARVRELAEKAVSLLDTHLQPMMRTRVEQAIREAEQETSSGAPRLRKPLTYCMATITPLIMRPPLTEQTSPKQSWRWRGNPPRIPRAEPDFIQPPAGGFFDARFPQKVA